MKNKTTLLLGSVITYLTMVVFVIFDYYTVAAFFLLLHVLQFGFFAVVDAVDKNTEAINADDETMEVTKIQWD